MCDPIHQQHYKHGQNQGDITLHANEAVCGHPEGLTMMTTSWPHCLLKLEMVMTNSIWFDGIIMLECLPLGGPAGF